MIDSILGYEGEITLGNLALALVGVIDPSWCDVNPGASDLVVVPPLGHALDGIAWRDIGRAFERLSDRCCRRRRASAVESIS